jgi:hypothetical protein
MFLQISYTIPAILVIYFQMFLIIYNRIIFNILYYHYRMFLEYCRLAYRFFVPRAERSIAGEITAITGAGSGT